MNLSTGPARAAAHPSTRVGSKPKRSTIDQLTACFSFPGLSNLATALADNRTRRRGARAEYPDIALLAVLAAARVVGGVQPAVRELNAGGAATWKVCSQHLTARVSDLRLPPKPPTRDQVETFQRRIERENLIDVLEEAFLDASVKMATWLGHFDPTSDPDWVHSDAKHTIYGDGTVIAPFSNATSWVHPQTGEIVTHGSRAKDAHSARIQSIRTDTAIDGKGDRHGINFVSLHTWTGAGRVVLATGHALGAETWTALDLIRAVQQRAAGAVHTVVYDGVLTGWIVDWLMGALRLQTVNMIKVRAKSDPATTMNHQQPLRARPALVASTHRAERLLADAGLAPTPALVEYERVAAIKRLYESNEPLPVGLCIYPRTGARTFEVVYSRHHDLGNAEHDVDGATCSHRLVVDDGALYVAERDVERTLVKTAMPRCTAATSAQDTNGTWNQTTTWQIPCPSGEFAHQLTWHPTGMFRGPGTKNLALRVNPLAELRPLARAHEGFGAVYGRRNDSESYNQWFQASLRHPGTAMSLSLTGQRLDFLMGAVLNNALTYDEAVRPRAAR